MARTLMFYKIKLMRDPSDYPSWEPLVAKGPASLNWTELNKNKQSKKQRRQK